MKNNLRAIFASAASTLVRDYGKAVYQGFRDGQPVDVIPYTRKPGPGYSFAAVKRMKRKRRNRLRAKGQFRKAVR